MSAQDQATSQEKPARRGLFRRKTKPATIVAEATAAPAATSEAEVAPEPTAGKRRSPLRLALIALPVLTLLGSGGVYGWHVWTAGAPEAHAVAEAHEDPVEAIAEATGEHAPAAAEGHGAPAKEASAGGHGEAEPASPPLPVAVAADDSAVTATDYAIVAVYENEAILATRRSLYRVKVGSRLPGLGEITGVEVVGDGGTVTGTEATLRAASVTAARPAPPAG